MVKTHCCVLFEPMFRSSEYKVDPYKKPRGPHPTLEPFGPSLEKPPFEQPASGPYQRILPDTGGKEGGGTGVSWVALKPLLCVQSLNGSPCWSSM